MLSVLKSRGGEARLKKQFENKTLNFEGLKWFGEHDSLGLKYFEPFIELLELLQTHPAFTHLDLKELFETIGVEKAAAMFKQAGTLKNALLSGLTIDEVLCLEIDKINTMFATYRSGNNVILLLKETKLKVTDLSLIKTEALRDVLESYEPGFLGITDPSSAIGFAVYFLKHYGEENLFLSFDLISNGLATSIGNIYSLKKYLKYYPLESLLTLPKTLCKELFCGTNSWYFDEMLAFITPHSLLNIEAELRGKIISEMNQLRFLKELSICNIKLENLDALQKLPTQRMRLWAVKNSSFIHVILENGFIFQEQLTNPTEDFMAHIETLPFGCIMLMSRGITYQKWSSAPESLRKEALDDPFSVNMSRFEKDKPTDALLLISSMKTGKAPPDDTFSHK